MAVLRSRTKQEKEGKASISEKTGSNEQEEGSDVSSILLLLLLYTLQGIPMGLASSIPFILQAKVSYCRRFIVWFCS